MKFVDKFKKDGSISWRIANMYAHGYTYRELKQIAHISNDTIRRYTKDVNKEERKQYIKSLKEKYGNKYRDFQKKRFKMAYDVYNRKRHTKKNKYVDEFYDAFSGYGS